jgi:hypothetical protein
MENNRREFLKLAGMAGAGLIIGTGRANSQGLFSESHPQEFNMHGYAAPKLDKVRVGFIGVGSRGSGTVKRMARVEGVEIKALCDIVPSRVNDVINSIKEYGHSPESFTQNEEDWKRLCDRDDIDLVIISTPWSLHTPQAVYAMEQGKHAGVEVPAAKTIEECWQLVKTSERTRKHCMMLANSAYGDFQLMTLNMARQGFFGEIIHGEGAYIHDRVNDSETRWVRDEENNNWFGYRPWRLEENSKRNGNLYPTHGLGTICQIMNLNYGDRMDYLVSTSSNDFSMGEKMKELAAKDEFYKPYVGRKFRGNMNVTTIRTERGRTIMVQHDISSPRPNIRFNLISGTKAIAQQYPSPAIATNHKGWLSDDEYQKLQETYQPEISKRVGQMAKSIGGHGGVDTLLVWRLVDCLRNGIPLDMDVYDAALWSCISPLSEWSVANRSNSIDVPDFTAGAYKTNKPGMDISLHQGGTIKLM